MALVFAARIPSDELAGIPMLEDGGLPKQEASQLLASVVSVPLDGRVRDQILSETRGNPLALLELLREATPVELAGGFGLPSVQRAGQPGTLLSGRQSPDCPVADASASAASR